MDKHKDLFHRGRSITAHQSVDVATACSIRETFVFLQPLESSIRFVSSVFKLAEHCVLSKFFMSNVYITHPPKVYGIASCQNAHGPNRLASRSCASVQIHMV
jgi:hypothetical protein